MKSAVSLRGMLLVAVVTAAIVGGGLVAKREIPAQVVDITRMHRVAYTALAMVKDRFTDVLLGNRDIFGLFHIADASTRHRLAHRLAYLLLMAMQEPLPIADGLVLSRQSTVNNEQGHGSPSVAALSGTLAYTQIPFTQ